MKSLISYLDCGKYKQPSGYDSGEFVVQMFSDLDEKIIPFFEKYPLVGDKLQDFSYFKIAASPQILFLIGVLYIFLTNLSSSTK